MLPVASTTFAAPLPKPPPNDDFAKATVIAIADFKKVLELSQDPQLRQMAEEELKALGAK